MPTATFRGVTARVHAGRWQEGPKARVAASGDTWSVKAREAGVGLPAGASRLRREREVVRWSRSKQTLAWFLK